ncbi:hypothetical protein D3C81_1218450 [compost metagenome]
MGWNALRGEDPSQRIAQRVVATVFAIAESLFRMAAEHRQQDLAELFLWENFRTADTGSKVDDAVRQRDIGVTIQP